MSRIHEMICAINGFFSLGPDGDDTAIYVGDIWRHSETLQMEWSDYRAEESLLSSRLIDLSSECDNRINALRPADVLDKYKQLCTLQAQYRLLRLQQSLSVLQGCQNILELPACISDVVTAAPTALPVDSKIFKSLLSISEAQKNQLIKRFNMDFESHLSDVADGQNNHGLWLSFFSEVRGRAVAFLLLSILPASLSGSGSVGEVYESSIDLMLSPMWSRMHFHLLAARREGTFRQLAWSFQYAKSFTESLCLFMSEITSDKRLAQILSDAGYITNYDFILDKISRFMRAHVAQFIETLLPSRKDAVMHIVESSLELDALLQSRGSISLRISEVVSSHNFSFNIWIRTDIAFIRNRLNHTCGDAEKSFECRFNSRLFTDSSVVGKFAAGINCFKCVYEVSWLLLQICQHRYCFLSMNKEGDVVTAIIEPLLCSVLGLLLFRIRTHDVLAALSRGRLASGVAYETDYTLMLPVSQLLESASYFKEVCRVLSLNKSFSRLRCMPRSFYALWKNMRESLSASSMFSEKTNSKIKSPLHIFELAFKDLWKSDDTIEISTDSRSDPLAHGSFDTYIDVQTILQYTETQMMLICQGLVEQYKELVEKYSISDMLINK